MIVIVDASAAYDLLTEGRCESRLVGAQELVSPDLIIAEVLNARWKVMRNGAVAPRLNIVLEFIDRLRIVPSLPYAAEAAQLADRLEHPVYDCLYVAAALRERARLLTVDACLSRKLRASRLGRLLR